MHTHTQIYKSKSCVRANFHTEDDDDNDDDDDDDNQTDTTFERINRIYGNGHMMEQPRVQSKIESPHFFFFILSRKIVRQRES